MLLNVRTFKRYQAWLAFVHLGFLCTRFMTVRLGDWSMWVFKDDWEIIMVTYCSETNTSEPAFTTIINLSEKKKKLIVQQKQGRTCKH